MDEAWRALVADDEPIIRDGILKSLNWSDLNIEIVAEAEDGEEALLFALTHQIHIVIVDLNMPILNGMNFIRRLKKQLPDCKVIIVTGFDKFQYAQEAIRLEVEEYLLKPLNAEELHQALIRICKDLESKEMYQKHLKVASQQIDKNINVLRERFCLDWISGNLSESEAIEQLGFLKLPESYPHTIGVIRWFEKDASKSYVLERDRQLYLFASENIIGEWLQPWPHFIFRNQQGQIIIFIWDELPEATIKFIRKSIIHYLKIELFYVFKKVEANEVHFIQSYQSASEQLFNQAQLSPIVRRAQQYMNEHYADPSLNLNGVAVDLQISPAYLSRQMKAELGYSFIHALTSIRIRHALFLLDSTSLHMNEIAHQVGYENQHYFSTSFKKNVGVSPIQYRQSHH